MIFYSDKINFNEFTSTEMKANLSGTELLEPLQNIYNSKQHNGYLTQIFVLTDGEVMNFHFLMFHKAVHINYK